jgi:nucleoporin NUP82
MPKVQGENVLTPEVMRGLAGLVEGIRTQIDSIRASQRVAEARAELQARELVRQQGTCQDILKSLEHLRNVRPAACKKRLQAAQEGQAALLGRMEKILRRLTMNASPELSEHETKWFKELSRMREEVVGAGRFDQDSLKARVGMVSFLLLQLH